MIVEYNSKNAIEFFKYSELYIKNEIKRLVSHLYEDFFFILGIELDDEPAGFIAVERRRSTAHIFQCLFVSEQHRGKGYSRMLVEAALEKSETEGVSEFYASYFENRNWTESLRKMYTRLGFERSGYVRNTFVLDKREIKQSIDRIKQRYGRFLTLEEDFRLKRIVELTPEEQLQIKHELGTGIPHNFNPLNGWADEDASVIILKDNVPLAWMIFEKRGSKMLYISQIYIKETCRKTGLFFSLICRAFDYTPEPVQKYFFYVNGDNDNMLGILRLFKNSNIKCERLIEMIKKF